MKYIIEFQDEDRSEYLRMLKATDLALALWRIAELRRDERDNEDPEVERIFKRISNIFEEFNVYEVLDNL